jgi:hypothetical protein
MYECDVDDILRSIFLGFAVSDSGPCAKAYKYICYNYVPMS